jgi:Tripartite tricarboxylate transporter TctB family
MRMNLVRMLVSKDILLGLIYIAFGAVYGGYTLRNLDIGTAVRMGPGYFPIVLSALIILIGVIVIFQGFAHHEQRPFGAVNWRAVGAISLSTVAFALLARGAGMVIATMTAALISSYASRHARWKTSLLTALFLSVFCTLVFVYGMSLPIGLFGTWFR